LVLHGTSGLPDAMVQRAVEHRVCKFNVNTEVRDAYLDAAKARLSAPSADLLDVMESAIAAMRAVVAAKLDLFGSVGKAWGVSD
jgi:tagatose 1,6-diphosphate aldolase GatY/KbaY